MKNKYLAIVLVLGLLSQQVMAGAVSPVMMGHSDSMHSAMSADAISGLDPEMGCQNEPNSSATSASLDCCDLDCESCSACSYSLVLSFASNVAVSISSQSGQQFSSEPLVQMLDALFRPPIFA